MGKEPYVPSFEERAKLNAIERQLVKLIIDNQRDEACSLFGLWLNNATDAAIAKMANRVNFPEMSIKLGMQGAMKAIATILVRDAASRLTKKILANIPYKTKSMPAVEVIAPKLVVRDESECEVTFAKETYTIKVAGFGEICGVVKIGKERLKVYPRYIGKTFWQHVALMLKPTL